MASSGSEHDGSGYSYSNKQDPPHKINLNIDKPQRGDEGFVPLPDAARSTIPVPPPYGRRNEFRFYEGDLSRLENDFPSPRLDPGLAGIAALSGRAFSDLRMTNRERATHHAREMIERRVKDISSKTFTKSFAGSSGGRPGLNSLVLDELMAGPIGEALINMMEEFFVHPVKVDFVRWPDVTDEGLVVKIIAEGTLGRDLVVSTSSSALFRSVAGVIVDLDRWIGEQLIILDQQLDVDVRENIHVLHRHASSQLRDTAPFPGQAASSVDTAKNIAKVYAAMHEMAWALLKWDASVFKTAEDFDQYITMLELRKILDAPYGDRVTVDVHRIEHDKETGSWAKPEITSHDVTPPPVEGDVEDGDSSDS